MKVTDFASPTSPAPKAPPSAHHGRREWAPSATWPRTAHRREPRGRARGHAAGVVLYEPNPQPAPLGALPPPQPAVDPASTPSSSSPQARPPRASPPPGWPPPSSRSPPAAAPLTRYAPPIPPPPRVRAPKSETAPTQSSASLRQDLRILSMPPPDARAGEILRRLRHQRSEFLTKLKDDAAALDDAVRRGRQARGSAGGADAVLRPRKDPKARARAKVLRRRSGSRGFPQGQEHYDRRELRRRWEKSARRVRTRDALAEARKKIEARAGRPHRRTD